MHELNDQELEQVVGGTFGIAGGIAGGQAHGGTNASNTATTAGTLNPTYITGSASNSSYANGRGSSVSGGATSFARGAVPSYV